MRYPQIDRGAKGHGRAHHGFVEHRVVLQERTDLSVVALATGLSVALEGRAPRTHHVKVYHREEFTKMREKKVDRSKEGSTDIARVGRRVLEFLNHLPDAIESNHFELPIDMKL